MKKQKILIPVLTVLMCFGITVAVFAAGMEQSSESLDEPQVCYAMWAVPQRSLNPTAPSDLIRYILSSDYQYAKVWVRNNGDTAITVTSHYDGKPFPDTYRIEPHSALTVIVSSHGNYGTYEVSIADVIGNHLNGLISIRTATTEDELGNEASFVT